MFAASSGARTTVEKTYQYGVVDLRFMGKHVPCRGLNRSLPKEVDLREFGLAARLAMETFMSQLT